jgi:hypothetical protein
MPKLTYRESKGIFQESGAGVDFTTEINSTTAIRKKVKLGTSNVTLGTVDSGCVLFMSATAGNTRKVTLPAASNQAGWEATLFVAATGSNYQIIAGSANELHGGWIHGTDGTTAKYAPITAAHVLKFGSYSFTASHGVRVGDRIDVRSDGSYMHVNVISNASGSVYKNGDVVVDE